VITLGSAAEKAHPAHFRVFAENGMHRRDVSFG
jgi:hypothetical protein